MGFIDRILNMGSSKKETSNKSLDKDEVFAENDAKKINEQKPEMMKGEEKNTIDSNKDFFQKKDDEKKDFAIKQDFEKKELYQKQDLEKKDQIKKDDEKKAYENKLWQQRIANDAKDAKDVRGNSNDKNTDLSKESYEEKKKELDEHLSKAGDEKAIDADIKVEESQTLASYKDNGLLKTTEHYSIHGARDQQEFLSKENSIFEQRQRELDATSKNQNLSPEERERAQLVKEAEYHSYQSEQYSRVISYEKVAAGFEGKERKPNEYDKQLNHHKEQANEAAQKLHDFDKQHNLVNDKCQAVADTPEFKRGRTVDPQDQQQALSQLRALDLDKNSLSKEQSLVVDKSSYKATYEPQSYNQNAPTPLNYENEKTLVSEKDKPVDLGKTDEKSKDKSEAKSESNELKKEPQQQQQETQNNTEPSNTQEQAQSQEKAPAPPAPEPAPAQTPPPPAPAPEYGYGGY